MKCQLRADRACVNLLARLNEWQPHCEDKKERGEAKWPVTKSSKERKLSSLVEGLPKDTGCVQGLCGCDLSRGAYEGGYAGVGRSDDPPTGLNGPKLVELEMLIRATGNAVPAIVGQVG